MKPRQLGNLTVSEIGMGCMGFSHGYGPVPERDYSIAAIRQAFEYGCTFFDTAEVYGTEQFYPGHNEQLVGAALEPLRKQVVLASKLHFTDSNIPPVSGDLDTVTAATAAATAEGKDSGNSVLLMPLAALDQAYLDSIYDILKRHLIKSLENLRTDYLDLYYLHRLHDFIPVQAVAWGMGRLKQEGFILGWGLSQVTREVIAAAHEVTPVNAVQNLYSMLERDCESEVEPFCLEHNIGLVSFSPIASGLLSGKVTVNTDFSAADDVRKFVPQLSAENIKGNQPILELIQRYADLKQATPAQISLAWMLHKYPNVVPIPGSKNQERIQENLQADRVCLTRSEFNELETALNACTVYGHRGINESQQRSFGNNWKK